MKEKNVILGFRESFSYLSSSVWNTAYSYLCCLSLRQQVEYLQSKFKAEDLKVE